MCSSKSVVIFKLHVSTSVENWESLIIQKAVLMLLKQIIYEHSMENYYPLNMLSQLDSRSGDVLVTIKIKKNYNSNPNQSYPHRTVPILNNRS